MKVSKEAMEKVFNTMLKDKILKKKLESTGIFMEILQKMSKDIEGFQDIREDYDKYLKDIRVRNRTKWHNENKRAVVGRDDTKHDYMLRWDLDTCLTKASPLNEGKSITDSNHMYNILNQEEMDVSYENEPLWGEPDVWKDINMFITYIMQNIEDATGDHYNYILRIMRDRFKMDEEVHMEHEIPKADEREEDLVKLKGDIKTKANELGCGVVGFTKIDRRFLGDGNDSVAPYQNIVILGMEMDTDQIEEMPTPGSNTGELWVMRTYADAGEGAHALSDFIRSKGWGAHPRMSLDGEVKFSHHAVNAGVANFGTSANVLTREYGPRARFCAVILEADLEPDQPKDFNIEEFCSRCRMCQKVCPVGAIPKEALRMRGAMRRRLNDKKCFSSMVGMNSECGWCIKVCPLHKFGFDKAIEAIPSYYSYNLN